MENHSDKIEKDAVPLAAGISGIVSTVEDGSELLDFNDNVQQSVEAVNNNFIMAQTNSTAVMTSNVMTFNQCSGINLGTTVHIGWSPGSSGAVARQSNSLARKDETVYQKTPTIKAMLESKELISTAFLDYISGYFGSRWREITILLEINQLFCDRMYEDNFDKGGTKEVSLRVFTDL